MEASLHSVGELAELLEHKYSAQLAPAPDYILYNGRQQLLNLYYPQEIERITEQTGFTPDCPEEVSELFDRLVEQFDRETAQSHYLYYTFEYRAEQGTAVLFTILLEENTGLVIPSYEMADPNTEDFPEEDWRELNRILLEIALYQGCPEQDRQQNTDRWQRFLSAQEYWDSVC